ncbi:MAG: 30S ribosomal protein S12 methylthiotransferase RimO [Clostridiales bacterium]|nr:30S ribosomal protein S12 methylthiotransferase RimO [Clostridiales bacterium]
MNTVGLVSLGCSKNRVDSEVLLGMLAQRGYRIAADPARADVIVVNTCGFIGPAKQESIDTLLEMAEYKKGGKLKLLIATGCLMQRYGEELNAEMPEVDAFLGVAQYERIFEAIRAAEDGQRPIMTGEGKRFFDTPRLLTTPPYSAYVKISDGCDNRCTYCAIPLIRGSYRSRPFDEIVAESRQLAERGATELTLIAQDTSRYGVDFGEKRPILPELLQAVSDIDGVRWLRALYCYPDTVDDRLLDAIAGLPKVCNYLDLPLQHINGRILRAMARRGSPEHIQSLIAGCRARGIALRTTMIVGFPGETDEEFSELLDFVRQAGFDRLGAFAYSPEEDTPAAVMAGQLPEEVKQARLDALMTAQQAISLEVNRARVGEVCEVLVEGVQEGGYFGRSRLEAPEIDGKVLFSSQKALAPGQYVPVRVTGAREYDLLGEACD